MKYIAFEGPDGSGKSTIAKAITEKLNELGHKSELFIFPGATALGKYLRKLTKTPHLIDENITISPYARQILFAADYVETINHIRNRDIDFAICDRLTPISSYVYGIAEGIEEVKLSRVSRLMPEIDCHVFIVHGTHLEKRNTNTDDHFDTKSSQFHKTISELYMGINSAAGEVTHVNNDGELDDTINNIMQTILNNLINR